MINLYMPLKNTSEKDKTQGGETLKLRNINRGLVLGGVLALGVVCYSVYDNNHEGLYRRLDKCKRWKQ